MVVFAGQSNRAACSARALLGRQMVKRTVCLAAIRWAARCRTGKCRCSSPALLPGSRAGELHRHLPVLHRAAHLIAAKQTVRFTICLPNKALAEQAARFDWPANTTIQTGGLPE